jgi:hypothetical protein
VSLVDLAQGLEGLLALFKDDECIGEPWARSEEQFEKHFGQSYEEFAVKLTGLTSDQHARYAATLDVNPEAAVLWVVMMSEV